jgi:UDP-3-O-[3-hydroxymyristoyl] N-acetylglucosamine deacetylase
MDAQRTLRRPISCAGIGLHSGNKVTLTLKPAAADTGIIFRRTDLGVEIPATVTNVSAVHYATVLGKDGATVETVEHLLAALVSVGIDNVVVELTHNEVPIMDGRAAPALLLVQEAGVKRLTAPRR